MRGARMPAPEVRIFLSGFMAAGKTTVGRELASQLGAPFVDLDESIERRQSASVADLFERFGERAFRDLESRELMRVVAARPGVVALGGGTVLREENRCLIRGAGKLVWLDAHRSTILARLRHGAPTRPLYLDPDSAARLLDERKATYQECDLRIRPAADDSPVELAAQIVQGLSL